MIAMWLLISIIWAGFFFFLFFINSIGLFPLWFRYVRVKMGGGGLILVKWRSKTGDYWKIGKLNKLIVKVKKRNVKHVCELTIPSDRPVFYRLMGVFACDVDEEKNSFCTVKYDAVPGFDEETYENLIIRALMNPRALNLTLIIILLAGAAIIALVGAYLTYHYGKADAAANVKILKAVADYCLGKVIP